MATIKIVLHKNWKHKSGTYPIVFQILHNRKKKVIYTSHNIIESDFDVHSQKVSPERQSTLSQRSANKINRDLNKRRKAFLSKIRYFETQGLSYTVDDMDENPVTQHDVGFLAHMDTLVADKRRMGSNGTADAYKSTRNSFANFLGDKRKQLLTSSITPGLIRHYADFLASTNVSDNTIAYYMRNLKAVYNSIVDDGFRPTELPPFKVIRTTICKTPKRAISREILIRIVNLKFELAESHMEIARDIFMFSYYCRGASFVDIIHMKKSDVVSGVIVYFRKKSKQPIRIAIIPQLTELMEKYSNDTNYIFPILDVTNPRPLYVQYRMALQRINYGLKPVGVRAGLDYPLTTYISRHTWATIVKNLGTPMSVISEGLGHTSERTTRIYLKEFDTSVLDKVNQEAAKLK